MTQTFLSTNSNEFLHPKLSVVHDTPDTSLNAALTAYELENIQSLGADETCELKTLLMHGATLDIWHTPTTWLPSGKIRQLAPIDLRRRILAFLTDSLRAEFEGRSRPLLDRAVLKLVHYLILLRIAPSATGRAEGRRLKPSSIIRLAYSFVPQLFASALTAIAVLMKAGSDARAQLADYDGPLFASLNLASFDGLPSGARMHVMKECKRMHLFDSLGFWSDIPTLDGESRSRVLLGAARVNAPPNERDSHLPLPDDYVAELASRCLWLIQDFAPNLFTLRDSLMNVWEETCTKGWAVVTIRDARRRAVVDILAKHAWRESNGRDFSTPPFDIKLPIPVGFGKSDGDEELGVVRWPPRNYIDFLCLIRLVQSAHLCIVFLCVGGRQSEILDLKRDCVVRERDGRAYSNGKTFKLVENFDGELRDWQLPEVATIAIEQQARLSEMSNVLGNLRTEWPWPRDLEKHLWVRPAFNRSMDDVTSPLYDINKALTTFVERIGLGVYPGGQRLRSHRFRKTIARLVALALVQAPKILMEIFGHKSFEMTLYYILTDKDLRAEIEMVTRELRVMRAKDVIEKMVEADSATVHPDEVSMGGYGGLAAIAISNAVSVHQERVHRRGDDWNAGTVIELAELLTLQGQAWESVRRGVLCTKLPGEAGPCNRSKGRPEPSKCSSSCGHRLEEEFLREDVDASIADSVAAYEQSTADAESLTAAHWASQIRAHLPRFPDLKAKWMANATVLKVIGRVSDAGVA